MNGRMEMNRQQLSGGISSHYEPPSLVVYGSVAELTKAQVAGAYTDRSYPAHTPVTNLTFSG